MTTMTMLVGCATDPMNSAATRITLIVSFHAASEARSNLQFKELLSHLGFSSKDNSQRSCATAKQNYFKLTISPLIASSHTFQQRSRLRITLTKPSVLNP